MRNNFYANDGFYKGIIDCSLIISNSPEQRDDYYNCGIFVIKYIDCLINEKKQTIRCP